MSAIGPCISIKPDSPNSLDFRVTSSKIYLNQKVETVVLSKMPRTQAIAEKEANAIASQTKIKFFPYNPTETVESRLLRDLDRDSYDFCDDYK